MQKKFIVVSQPRSGTTYFCNNALRSNPQVWCWDSLFSQDKPNTLEYLQRIGLEKYKGDGIRSYLETHYKKAYEKYGRELIGFKLFIEDIDIKKYEDLLTCGEFKIILLHRNNILKSIISLEIALATGQWSPMDKKEYKPITIDIDLCRYRIENYRSSFNITRNVLESNNVEYYEIEYDQIFKIEEINKVFEFLGVGPITALPDPGEPLNSPSRYRLIENIDEIEATLGSEQNGYLFK